MSTIAIVMILFLLGMMKKMLNRYLKMTKLEEFENLKNENARLTTQVKALEKQVKALNMQLRLERELAAKQEVVNILNQMQISEQEREFLIRQNTISQMRVVFKEKEI